MKMKKRGYTVLLVCLLLLAVGVGIALFHQVQYRRTLAYAKTWSCFKNDPENVHLHFHWCDIADGVWIPHWQINSSQSQRYARRKMSILGTCLER